MQMLHLWASCQDVSLKNNLIIVKTWISTINSQVKNCHKTLNGMYDFKHFGYHSFVFKNIYLGVDSSAWIQKMFACAFILICLCSI